jgi:hypothetical protein
MVTSITLMVSIDQFGNSYAYCRRDIGGEATLPSLCTTMVTVQSTDGIMLWKRMRLDIVERTNANGTQHYANG